MICYIAVTRFTVRENELVTTKYRLHMADDDGKVTTRPMAIVNDFILLANEVEEPAWMCLGWALYDTDDPKWIHVPNTERNLNLPPLVPDESQGD